MADTIKCPNCSANLVFEPGAQKLQCDYCGGLFDINELKLKVEELTGEDALPEVNLKETEEEVELEHLDAIEDVGKTSDNVEFVCNACGGKILSDSSTAASFCPFCGSPALIGQRLTGEFEPKYIIPFKYNRAKAEQAFLKWCKGGKFTPVKFVSQENIAKLTGLYVPFWLYDMKEKVDVTGKGTTTRTSGNYTIITDYEYYIDGELLWEKMPFDGETRINDELMEAIEPFDYKELVPYDYKYLPGFFADRYDQSEEALKKRISDRCREYLSSEIDSKVKKYQTHKTTKQNNKLVKMKSEYALLPVWFMHYKYLGRDYYFAMNGQTGEVAGKAPVSRVKQLMLFSVLLALISVVFRFIAGLIMGGYVG
ncbi:MAG: hypothetical protein IJ757_05125 [Clostridiales bacterium]|nr:hypothetical protein [Clostridiales bacterium]